MSLDRFHEAWASRWAGYDAALAEIRRGRKINLGCDSSSMARSSFLRRRPRPLRRNRRRRQRPTRPSRAVASCTGGRGIALEDLMQPHPRPQARFQPPLFRTAGRASQARTRLKFACSTMRFAARSDHQRRFRAVRPDACGRGQEIRRTSSSSVFGLSHAITADDTANTRLRLTHQSSDRSQIVERSFSD